MVKDEKTTSQSVATLHCSIKTLWWQGSAEHLPDAVTIVTVLHFLPTAHREMERRRGREGPKGKEGDERAFLWEHGEINLLRIWGISVSTPRHMKTATPFIVRHKRTIAGLTPGLLAVKCV